MRARKLSKRRILRGFTALFYVFYFVIFISNNTLLESFAKRIDEEIIRPYTQSISPTPFEPPQTSNQEVSADPTSQRRLLTPTPSPEETVIYITPTPNNVQISEQMLWEALTLYRHDHGKTDVQLSDSLCSYARERAQELYGRLGTNPENPLDGHAGFSRDADSGYVFEKTGFNTVGENLAYTPSYTTATQVIEWGWDSSPGHRSLQLSDDITHGCITGIHPIYVGIYTY